MSVDLKCVVKRGRGAGTALKPHKHDDGMYVVSKSRFAKDYERVADLEAVVAWIERGYSVRMSNPESEFNRAPSLVTPESIEGLEPG